MTYDDVWKLRLAVLSTLVANAPQKPGRTALMKFAYLLQTVKGVPLGYHFRLYNYGPYDSTVIGDLSQAETFEAVKEDPAGGGYEYSSVKRGHAEVCKDAKSQLARASDSIEWVLREFGKKSAADLELISTIVYAEREMRSKKRPRSSEALCRIVKEIKPHFTEAEIAGRVAELEEKGLILADGSG
jgi:hypothetical protein